MYRSVYEFFNFHYFLKNVFCDGIAIIAPDSGDY